MKRLLKRSDFLAAAKTGERHITPGFIVQVYRRETANSFRYGITATRKIGGAVERNRAKRRLRAMIQQILVTRGHPGYDYVFIARTEILKRDFTQMTQDLEDVLMKLHKKVEQ